MDGSSTILRDESTRERQKKATDALMAQVAENNAATKTAINTHEELAARKTESFDNLKEASLNLTTAEQTYGVDSNEYESRLEDLQSVYATTVVLEIELAESDVRLKITKMESNKANILLNNAATDKTGLDPVSGKMIAYVDEKIALQKNKLNKVLSEIENETLGKLDANFAANAADSVARYGIVVRGDDGNRVGDASRILALAGQIDAADPDSSQTLTGAEGGGEPEVEYATISGTGSLSEVEGEADRKRVLKAQQCFLLYNNSHFAQIHRRFLSSKYGAAQADKAYKGETGTNLTPGYATDKYTDKTRIYLVDDQDADNDSTILNRIKIKSNESIFDTISPAEYSQLLPHFRLYKVLYDRGNKNEGARGYVEFKFDTHIDINDLTAVDKSFSAGTVGENGKNVRGTGCGVESFEWKYLGSDPFTATKDLEATLKLYFLSFPELTNDRPGKLNGTEENYRYLDLILQGDCGDKDNSGRVVYDPGCYEIMAEVGYSAPAESYFPGKDHGVSDTERKVAITESINNSVEKIYLVMTDHTINFNQDGSFSLEINYRARLGSQMNSRKFNVLIPGGGNSIGGPAKEIASYKERVAEAKKAETAEADSDPAGAVDPAADSKDDTKSQQLQREFDLYMTKKRQDFYNIIYSSLDDRGFIHTHNMSKEELNKFLNYDQVKKKKKGKTVLISNLPDPLTDDVKFNTYSQSADGTRWIIADEEVLEASDETDDPETQEEENEEQVTAVADARLVHLQQFLEDGNHTLNFVYLGDILAVVTHWIMGEETYGKAYTNKGGTSDKDKDSKLKPISEQGQFTNIQMNAVAKYFKVILANIKLKNAVSGKMELVNLAHIAISLEAFLDFMTRRVVSKKRTFYSYFSFINDLIRDLVGVNLNVSCFAGIKEGNIKPSASIFKLFSTMKDGANEGCPIEASGMFRTGDYDQAGFYKKFNPALITPESPLNGLSPVISPNLQTPDVYEYLMVGTSTTAMNLYGIFDLSMWESQNGSGKTTDRLGDKKRGIPHYTFGANKGILKTAEFQKTDQEFLAEARYEEQGSSAINQLSAVYDVTFEMLGTARFQPGQYIYFDPITVGIGRPNHQKGSKRSYSNLMGLGGYHLIIEISSHISRDGYNTTLKTRWVTSGKPNNI